MQVMTVLVDFQATKNIYGRYTDDYLVESGSQNPYEADFTEDGQMVMNLGGMKPEENIVMIPLNFSRPAYHGNYVEVDFGPDHESFIQNDGTIRPSSDHHLCALADNHEIKSKVRWTDCTKADGIHSKFVFKATDEGYGYVSTVGRAEEQLCWSI